MVLASAVCYATIPTLAKVSYDHGADPISVLLIRFALAGVLLLVVSHLFVRPLRRRPEHRNVALLSLLFAAQALSFFVALSLASATIVVLLLYVYPLVVTIASALLLGERITAVMAGALAVGLTGIVLTVGGVSGDLHAGGVALALASGILFAGFMLLSKRILATMPSLEMIGLVYASSALIYLLVTSVRGFTAPNDGTGWLAVAAITVVGTLIAMVLLTTALKRLPAGVTAMLTILEPAVAAAIAAAVLGETVSTVQAIGIAMVLGALLMLGGQMARGSVTVPPAPPP